MSLYLKYRPQNFKTVVGQDHIVTTLTNALKHEAITHAYLFSGPRGTGKTSLARILAKSLNCPNLEEGIEPCDQCENCQAILNGRLVDLIEIDAASNRGIDEIRELREKILFAPTQGKSKVYIIDEVHMLTKEAFNALLKTLEEPPAHVYFILATTEAHKIPETIISRCQQFNFKRISQEAIVKRLEGIATEEKIQAEPDALQLIAKMSNGGLRDAIGLFEQMTMDGSIIYQEVINHLGITGHMLIESFYQALLNKDSIKAVELINRINGQGQNLNQFCGEFIAYLREQMLLGVNEKKDIKEVISFIDIFSEAKQQINQALIPQLPLEIAVIKACGFKESSKETPKDTAVTSGAAVETHGNASPEETVEKPAAIQKETISETTQETKEEEAAIPHELTLDKIKQNWQQIIDRIETPFIRMSFNDGDPVKLEKGSLHMAFKSSTLMEKVANTKNQSEILNAFKTVLNAKPMLKLEMRQINLKPITETKEGETPSIAQEESPSIVEMAKEVFGG